MFLVNMENLNSKFKFRSANVSLRSDSFYTLFCMNSLQASLLSYCPYYTVELLLNFRFTCTKFRSLGGSSKFKQSSALNHYHVNEEPLAEK